MTRIVVIMTIGVTLLVTPARLYAQHLPEHAGPVPEVAVASAQAHDHAVAQSPAAKPDIDALVAKMNAAIGAARIDAIAELLTAMVQKQKECETKMAGMMSGMAGHSGKAPDSPSPAP